MWLYGACYLKLAILSLKWQSPVLSMLLQVTIPFPLWLDCLLMSPGTLSGCGFVFFLFLFCVHSASWWAPQNEKDLCLAKEATDREIKQLKQLQIIICLINSWHPQNEEFQNLKSKTACHKEWWTLVRHDDTYIPNIQKAERAGEWNQAVLVCKAILKQGKQNKRKWSFRVFLAICLLTNSHRNWHNWIWDSLMVPRSTIYEFAYMSFIILHMLQTPYSFAVNNL